MYYRIHHEQVAINRDKYLSSANRTNQALIQTCAPSTLLDQKLPQDCLLLPDKEGIEPATSPHHSRPIAGVFL